MCHNCLNCDPVLGCLECNSGKFGPYCTKNCSENCLNLTFCDRNGSCIKGCVDGWFGSHCDMKCSIENCVKCTSSSSMVFCENCGKGFYVDNEGQCKRCPSNCITCDNESICTHCKPTFTGTKCEEKCHINCVDGFCEIDGTCTYGCNNSKHGVGCIENCKENCVHCFNENNCTKCLPGFGGQICAVKCSKNCINCRYNHVCESCKPGFYGIYCGNMCPDQCLTCDSEYFCTSCRDGWSGNLCQCSANCHNDECEDNGKCLNGCKDSFYGDYCTASCPSKNCLKCDQFSGNCTQCSKGLYGINCSEKCTGSCLETMCNMTGACLDGCTDGFAGVMCTESRE